MPKVSICVPTCNQPGLVRRTLESILAQNFEDYEVIVTDDSDGGAISELVSSIDDKRILYYKNERQLGSPTNWNRAISLAKGEYIKVIHHDDWFPNKDCLMQFVKLLDEHPSSVLGFSSSYACQSDGSVAYVHAPSTAQLEELRADPSYLVFNNYIGAPSATIFRNKEHTLFDENFKWLVDIDFYITLLSSSCSSYSYTSDPLICIAIEGDHKVTNECSGIQQVEISEHVLLFNKIRKKPYTIFWYKYFIFFSFLLSRFDIGSVAEFCHVAKIKKISVLQGLALMLGKNISILKFVKKTLKGWFNKFRVERFRPKVSYSQCGEDIIVDFIFMWLGRKNITYLDVGTNDPVKLNNTYFFYKKKCRGVLVEPDPRLFRKIKKMRSKDICLNAGMGVGAGNDITFFLMQPDTLSTSSPEKAKEYIKLGVNLKSEFKVPLININAVIETHFGSSTPDYLSVDVEGLDFEIIKSLDLLKHRPIVICAETLTYTNNNTEMKIPEISQYLCCNGYFIYADTYINTIFVDSGVWNKRRLN